LHLITSSSTFSSFLCQSVSLLSFFFFTASPTPEIYTLSLHDPLPICTLIWLLLAARRLDRFRRLLRFARPAAVEVQAEARALARSEEHTSELQSPCNLVCRLLLEKKKYRATHMNGRNIRTSSVMRT